MNSPSLDPKTKYQVSAREGEGRERGPNCTWLRIFDIRPRHPCRHTTAAGTSRGWSPGTPSPWEQTILSPSPASVLAIAKHQTEWTSSPQNQSEPHACGQREIVEKGEKVGPD